MSAVKQERLEGYETILYDLHTWIYNNAEWEENLKGTSSMKGHSGKNDAVRPLLESLEVSSSYIYSLQN